MSYKYILYEKKDGAAYITFNKPEKMNTLTFIGRGDDMKEILDAMNDAAEDDDIRALVLRGAGRAFCAGHDLNKVGFVYGMGTGKKEERRPSQRIRLITDRRSRDDFSQFLYHPKITIAQVHGCALEGGLFLATMCDITIAADDAQLGMPGQRLGFAGHSPMSMLLLLNMGLKRSLGFMISGKSITGKEAAEVGLVTASVPPDKLEEEVQRWVEIVKTYPRDGIAMGKAARRELYSILGIDTWFAASTIQHTLFTNIRWEPDEFNFFKQRRDTGAKTAFHERDKRYD